MYRYEGCHWPPQRITGDAYYIFNFGRKLPLTEENSQTSEFLIKWTKELENEFIRIAQAKTWVQLADYFCLQPQTVRRKYTALVAAGRAPKRAEYPYKWSQEDTEYLMAHYNDSLKQLVEHFNRSDGTICWKIRSLGLKREKKALYTAEEDEFILQHYAGEGSEYCAEHLHRPLGSVQNRAFRLGLRIGGLAKKYAKHNAAGRAACLERFSYGKNKYYIRPGNIPHHMITHYTITTPEIWEAEDTLLCEAVKQGNNPHGERVA